MAEDFSGKIDVVVDYRTSGSPSSPPSSAGGGFSAGGGGAFAPQQIQAQQFLRQYPKANQQSGAIRAVKAQEAVWKADIQRIRKEQAEKAKYYAELEAAEQLKVNLELASIQRRMALQQEHDANVASLLQQQTNEKLAEIQLEMAQDNKEMTAFTLAHKKRMSHIQEQAAMERLQWQRERQEKQRQGGSAQQEETNKYLGLIAKSTGFLAATFGIGMMFKQSRVANTLLGTISKMLGMMIDLFIMPFMPLILPLMRWLARFVQGFAKFMNNPTGFIKDSLDIGLPEWLNKPMAIGGGALGLAGAGLVGKAIFNPWDTIKGISTAIKGLTKFLMTGSFGGGGGGANLPKFLAAPGSDAWNSMMRILSDKREPEIAKFFNSIFGPEKRDKYAENIGRFLNKLFGPEARDKYVGNVKDFFSKLMGEDARSRYAKNISTFFESLFDRISISEQLTKVRNFFGKVFAFDEHLSKIDDFFKGLFGRAKIDEFGKWITDFFKSLPKPTMPDFLKHIFGAPKGDFTLKGLLEFLQKGGDKLASTASRIPSSIGGATVNAWDEATYAARKRIASMKAGGLDLKFGSTIGFGDEGRMLYEYAKRTGGKVPKSALLKLIAGTGGNLLGPAGGLIDLGMLSHKGFQSARDTMGPQFNYAITAKDRAMMQSFLKRVNTGDESYWGMGEDQRREIRRTYEGFMTRWWQQAQGESARLVENKQTGKVELVVVVEGKEKRYSAIQDIRDKIFTNRISREWTKDEIEISNWELLGALFGYVD